MASRILASLCATEEKEGLRRIQATLRRGGIDFFVYGMGQEWRGNGMKQVAALMAAKTHYGRYKYIMSLDAYDTICIADEEEIIDKFRALRHPMVISAETNCWPDKDKAEKYPPHASASPFRFLNGGGYIADVDYLIAMLGEWGVTENFKADSDQRFLTEKFLAYPGSMVIDTECSIFQTLWTIKAATFLRTNRRFVNRITSQMPCVFHGNGRTNMEWYWKTMCDGVDRAGMMDWVAQYEDEANSHRWIVREFTGLANADSGLKAHRDFVEQNSYGFGERAFHWMWKLLIGEMPTSFRLAEIGVYKGQVLSLVRMLAMMHGKSADITGITPLSKFSGVTGRFREFGDEDYLGLIRGIHGKFGLPFDDGQIVRGDSTDKAVVGAAAQRGPFDIVYIDGCHEYDYVVKDIENYGPMVRKGGFLVVDDSSNFLKMYDGAFAGHEDVSMAVRDRLEDKPEWKHLMAVMHNRIFQKV